MPRRRKNLICSTCGAINFRDRSKYCSVACAKIISQETRDKISKARIKYLRENPDKHVWKRASKFRSEPCEQLKKYLTDKGLKFVEEWTPLEDRYFSIDIAFPDIKFGIEVNGNQHYNSDDTLKEYYQNRHDIITDAGWKLIELHYSSCFNEQLISGIISHWKQPDYSQYFEIKRLRAEKRKVNAAESRGVKAKRKTDEKMIPKIEQLLKSDIDFSRLGWVKNLQYFWESKSRKYICI